MTDFESLVVTKNGTKGNKLVANVNDPIAPPHMDELGSAFVNSLSVGSPSIHSEKAMIGAPVNENELFMINNSLQAKSTLWITETGPISPAGLVKKSFSRGLNPSALVLQPEGGNVGIGTSSPNAMLDVQGDIKVNDKNLWLRGGTDNNHGIGWYGGDKLFAGMNIDGPAVFGFSSGALGTTRDGQKIALQWNGDGKGNVLINGILDCGGPIRTGDVEANGNINVKGDVFLTGADCAEEFNVAGAESVEPGTVMVIEGEGSLRPSEQAYDKRVAGVISGAGNLRPGITLDRQNDKTNRLPLALSGKVYCKIDAQYGGVELGDLLTTSPTCGYAMKADDPFKAFGSVIGKALRPMETGQGMIPILVALQ